MYGIEEMRQGMLCGQRRLLIVEDDRKLNDGIVLALRGDMYAFSQCRTIADARKVMVQEDISLMLLDVNLPDGNGIDFVREVRTYSQIPILLITVNSMELDIVTGLEAGANAKQVVHESKFWPDGVPVQSREKYLEIPVCCP